MGLEQATLSLPHKSICVYLYQHFDLEFVQFLKNPSSNAVHCVRMKTLDDLKSKHILSSLDYIHGSSFSPLRIMLFGYTLSGQLVERQTAVTENVPIPVMKMHDLILTIHKVDNRKSGREWHNLSYACDRKKGNSMYCYLASISRTNNFLVALCSLT